MDWCVRSARSERVGNRSAGVDPDALDLKVLVDRVDAVLAADARILVASEWREEADLAVGVDPEAACLDALMPSAIRIARPMSRVQTPEARPKRTSLAIASASASSLNLITESTGPKTSSWAMRIRLVTPAKIVGSMNQPLAHSGRVAAAPPSISVAPSFFAMSM